MSESNRFVILFASINIRKEKFPCSLCANMRRGALNTAAVELNCNKVALGHHFDDTVETLMMNLFIEGRFGCFSPVTYLDRIGVTVIRPLIYCPEKEIIGFIMLGHVRTDMPFSAILGKIEEYRFDVSKTQTLYDSLPVFDSQKIDGIMGVVDMLVTCLVSENILYTKHNESYEAVRKYIYNNYDKKLTARDIAHNVHMSKTTLYKTVKTFTGYSINEFLNLVRIEKSKELLVGTDIPIENIAKKLGFSSITYYTRLFKKAVGVPPSVYRKNGKYELKDFSVRKERLNDDK